MTRVTVPLARPAGELAQEEILKKIAHLSKEIGRPAFADDGGSIEFDAPERLADDHALKVANLAQVVQRGLRGLQRKVEFRSSRMDRPLLRGSGLSEGVHLLGNGQAALQGLPLRLYRYFDRVFRQLGEEWDAEPLLTPTLIPTTVLAKCDYFRSFPHNVTFAAHLYEDADRIEAFRSRHQDREALDAQALHDMETPEACLTPAVCYHVYHLHQGQRMPAGGRVYGVCGRCFRYESANMRDLRRLWDFTMREIVFLGERDAVLSEREHGNERVARFLEEHELAGEIRTASDPFFYAPDAAAKTYFQIGSETKYEISLLLPEDERLAAGSLNYHTDFFGRAFDVAAGAGGPMHSVCIAFGLERWVYGFLAQHGDDVGRWPGIVGKSLEFSTRA